VIYRQESAQPQELAVSRVGVPAPYTPVVPICANCGEENPARARFCMTCAAALTVAGSQEVRKTVTVVFSDLKGSTSLGEALDAESLRDVMGRYFERMRAILHGHGAAVEKFIGDAVMAVFGLPRVHEDDALRAVRAAWQMQRVLQELNDELQARWGVRLLARIGVNTGEVVAGDPATGQRLVTGDPVNTAARLEQAAGPGEVLVGENTYRMVRHAVRVEAVGPLAVKGKAEPVTAYRLVEVMPRTVAAMRRLDTPMVGRGGELRLLEAALDRAIARRRCELAVVIGEPGMGKSRLLVEFEEKTVGRARPLHARCPPYGEGITFWPLAEMVQDAATGSAGIAGQEGADLTGATLAGLMEGHPEAAAVAARVGSALGLSPEPFPLEEIYRGTRMLLTHLAKERPLILAVEDIHWAEAAFLDLLDHLSDRTEDAAVLVVCSGRPELSDGRPGVLGRHIITLEPLSVEESSRLIVNLLGSSGLPAPAQKQIQQAAAGNPLFIEQILSMLADGGYLPAGGNERDRVRDPSSFSVPPSISALLSARLDDLPAEERAVIERASVPGQVFAQAAVAELCDVPLRPRVDPCLHALTRKAFVAPGQDSSSYELGWFRFRHALIRDTAYGAMLKKLRAELHERFGCWLETQNGGAFENEELLGYHLEQAYLYRTELGPPDDHTVLLGRRAAQSLASAGRRALTRGDVGAAVKLLRRVGALLPLGDLERPAVMVDLGGALRENGDHAAAIDVLDQAVGEAKTRGDAGLECRALVERFEIDMKLGTSGWPDGAWTEAQRLIPRLEAIGDDFGLAKTWRMLSWVHGAHGSLAGWDQASQRAIHYARKAGDLREEIEVLAGLSISATFGPMPVGKGIRRCEEILRQVKGNSRAEAFVLEHLGHLQAMVGRFMEARTTISQSVDMYDEIGAFGHASRVRSVAAEVELLAGDITAAEEKILEIFRFREQRGLQGPSQWLDLYLARVRCERSGYQEALPLAEADWELDPEDALLAAAVRGKLLARLGKVAKGESHIRDALARTAEIDAVIFRGEALMALGEVLRLAGRGEEAARVLEQALHLWKQKGHVVMTARTQQALAAVVADG
jgi:class 3 adenylate cyclase/tetratricopeptide (TPR) repeat protein